MNKDQFKIVGLGEILFDILPSNKKMPGGATANFAYICGQLGNDGVIASRIGEDLDGKAILKELSGKNIDISAIQTDAEHPTGTVIVKLQNGQPVYEITEKVAWDFLEFTENWQELAESCDAVCFGSLAQRNRVSSKTIQKFLASTREDCLKVFDVNLRQRYFSKDIIERSLKSANILKVNHEELPVIVEMFGIKGSNVTNQLENLRRQFGFRLVCLTLGKRGSLLLSENEVSEHRGLSVKVSNTIGAGDAFTATLTHGVLHGWSLEKINEKANRVAAFVASKDGAMPDFEGFEPI